MQIGAFCILGFPLSNYLINALSNLLGLSATVTPVSGSPRCYGLHYRSGALPVGEVVVGLIITGAYIYDNWDNIVAAGSSLAGAISSGWDWLFSKSKGERNQTAKPDGTNNPFKKLKPDPSKFGNVLEKNSHTGKTVSKPGPPGYFEWLLNKKK